MDLELDGKRALVTGASRGIGEAAARVLAKDGARCAIAARRMELLEKLADEIEADGGIRPVCLQVDLFEPGAPAKLAAAAEEALGGVDIVVHSAGRSKAPDEPRNTPFDHPSEKWELELHLNYVTIREMTLALMPGMQARKYGRVINITGKMEPEKVGTANPPKAAVHAWAKGLSRVVAKDNVTINSLPPGKIVSEQILRNYTPEERAAYSDGDISLGYLGEGEDMAHLIAFLASPRAEYITGTVIPVDGGYRKFAF